MIKHLAIIMDGNRRWAKKNGLDAYLGHLHGTEAAKRTVDFCLEKNIPYLSLWVLSTENYFKRSKTELDYLFNLLVKKIEENLDQYKEKKVRVRFIGDKSLYPASVLTSCQKVEDQTKDLNKMQLNILFCYGGRQEIIAGVKNIVNKINAGQIKIEDVNDQNFSNYLWLSDTPEPDIVIRTGDHQRISNFILYQSAYSELYFLDCLWPDFKNSHLQEVLEQFNHRKRNFGA
jgi:undecaprenyl diphosphate synthase